MTEFLVIGIVEEAVYVVKQGKLAARKAHKLAEERRKAEEAAAKQFVDEQQRQMASAQGSQETDDLFKAPEVSN